MLVSRKLKKMNFFHLKILFRLYILISLVLFGKKKIYNLFTPKIWKLPQLLSASKMRVMEDLNIKMELCMKVSGELLTVKK